MTHLFKLQPLTAALIIASNSMITLPSYASHETKPIQLAPIVVTAQAKSSDANGLIVHVDPKQPIQPIPASDGAAYLKSIAGFNTINSGGTNGDITFRGMFGSRIKVLTDGTENLGACPSRMDSPTSYISPESFDEISIIKGPQTVAYANTGSAATVIFKKNAPSFEDQNYQGQASIVMGSFGRLDHNVDVAIGNDDVYARLNANRSESKNYKDGDGQYVPSAWEKWNTDLALGFTPDADTQIELKLGKSDGEAVYAGRGMDGSKFARESIGILFNKEHLSEHLKNVEAQIDYSFNDHVMDNFSLRPFTPSGMMKDPMSTNVSRKTLNSRIAGTYGLGEIEIKAGLDHQRNQHTTRSSNGTLYVSKPRLKDMDFSSTGLFTELKYTINPQHHVVFGARADDVKVDDLRQDSLDKSYNNALNKTLASGFIRLESESKLHDAKSYIGIGYVERMPDYWELFSPKTGNHGSTNTFNGVQPEKTLQLDLGYQHQQGAFSSWASAYAGVVKDFILIDYSTPAMQMQHGHTMNSSMNAHNMPNNMGGMPTMSHGPTTQARNIDATIAGAEIGLSYEFSDHIQSDVNIAYAWGENTTDHKPLAQISPLETRLNLRYIEDRFSLGAYVRHVTKQDRVSLKQGNIVGYDLAPSKSFTTLSLNASYSFDPLLDLSIGVDNLLDETYTEHLNKAGNSGFSFATDQQFNSIGRNYWTRLSLKF